MGVAASMTLSILALALFSVATARHHLQLFGRLPPARVVLTCRIVASLVIVAAPFPWITQTSLAMGLVTWLFCGVPMAALAVVAGLAALPTRPRK